MAWVVWVAWRRWNGGQGLFCSLDERCRCCVQCVRWVWGFCTSCCWSCGAGGEACEVSASFTDLSGMAVHLGKGIVLPLLLLLTGLLLLDLLLTGLLLQRQLRL